MKQMLGIAVLLFVGFVNSTYAAPPRDMVCEALFHQYLMGGKIESADVDAAIHLVARRGRSNGFWQVVLAEFEKSFESDSQTVRKNTLAVLSKMLRRDGSGRWFVKQSQSIGTQRAVARPLGIYLGPEVLEQIIARAAKASRNELDQYVLAVRAAHDPRGKAFLTQILLATEEEMKESNNVMRLTPHPTDSEFHAAVGLAELGEHVGVEWLIVHAHSEAPGSISYGRHFRDRHGRMTDSCQHSLADLTGEKATLTRSEWETWWAENKKDFKPKKKAFLRSRY